MKLDEEQILADLETITIFILGIAVILSPGMIGYMWGYYTADTPNTVDLHYPKSILGADYKERAEDNPVYEVKERQIIRLYNESGERTQEKVATDYLEKKVECSSFDFPPRIRHIEYFWASSTFEDQGIHTDSLYKIKDVKEADCLYTQEYRLQNGREHVPHAYLAVSLIILVVFVLDGFKNRYFKTKEYGGR